MSRLQKKESLKEARRRLIIDTAFRIFVEQKIEPVSMGEIASAAGIGSSWWLLSVLPSGRSIWMSWMQSVHCHRSEIFRRSTVLPLHWTAILTCTGITKTCCSIMTISIIMSRMKA